MMWKSIFAGLLSLALSTTAPFAQDAGSTQPPRRLLAQADASVLTDVRLAALKAALQLTPEQAKLWPAVEEAVRARAAGRQVRLMTLKGKLESNQDEKPIDLLRERSANLIQRGTELKNLADAWDPLAATLSPEQQHRLQTLAEHLLNLMHNAVEDRRTQMSDEGDE